MQGDDGAFYAQFPHSESDTWQFLTDRIQYASTGWEGVITEGADMTHVYVPTHWGTLKPDIDVAWLISVHSLYLILLPPSAIYPLSFDLRDKPSTNNSYSSLAIGNTGRTFTLIREKFKMDFQPDRLSGHPNLVFDSIPDAPTGNPIADTAGRYAQRRLLEIKHRNRILFSGTMGYIATDPTIQLALRDRFGDSSGRLPVMHNTTNPPMAEFARRIYGDAVFKTTPSKLNDRAINIELDLEALFADRALVARLAQYYEELKASDVMMHEE